MDEWTDGEHELEIPVGSKNVEVFLTTSMLRIPKNRLDQAYMQPKLVPLGAKFKVPPDATRVTIDFTIPPIARFRVTGAKVFARGQTQILRGPGSKMNIPGATTLVGEWSIPRGVAACEEKLALTHAKAEG